MALFKVDGNSVHRVKARGLDLEKNLQHIVEENLEEVLGVTFLYHEYPTSFGGRMDTLGIDADGSPCIVEYKRGQNDNVINQGLSYLRWLLDHKADFERLCTEKNIQQAIGWDSPRVICIASSYNKFDSDTAELLPIKIELLRYQMYEGNMFSIEPQGGQKIKLAMGGIVGKAKVAESATMQKHYTVEERLTGVKPSVVEAFNMLREQIIALDETIDEQPKKIYVAYKLARNFTDLIVMKSKLVVALNVKYGSLEDPKGLLRDMRQQGHWGNGDYEIFVMGPQDVEYAMFLIRQSYELNK